MEKVYLSDRQTEVTFEDNSKFLASFFHIAFTTYQNALNHELRPQNTPKSAKWVKYEDTAELIAVSLDEDDRATLLETAREAGGPGIAEAVFFQALGLLSGDEWEEMCSQAGIKINSSEGN